MRPYVILLSALLAVSFLLIFLGDRAKWFVRESGPVEMTTVILYGVLLLLLLWKRPLKWKAGNLLSSFIVLFLLLRELDFDKAFTTMGVFKSAFYKSAEVPLTEKLIAGFLIASIAAATITLTKHYYGDLLSGIKIRSRTAWGIFTAALLAFVSKAILDGLPGKLEDIGLMASARVEFGHTTLEEVFELGISISLLLAFLFLLTGKGNEDPDERGLTLG